LRVLAAGVLMAGTAGLCPGAQEALPEYEVKAAIIYNFARFTEWPADVLRGNEFPIGILGSETAQGAFQKVLRGKQIGDRQVRLLRGKTPEDLQDCVLIFVADSEKAHHVTLLDLYRKRPVLTIGETEGFAASGGILNFYLEATKVKFEINPDAAARAGLKVTKLIGVAPRKVKDR
jgi:preprotein translocase subunit Sec61beta